MTRLNLNKFKYFDLDQITRERYHLDHLSCYCSNKHVAKGAEKVKAPPHPECGETFDARIHAYLATRLGQLSLTVKDGTSRRFSATENPASVHYSQFLRVNFAFHGVPGAGMENPE